MLEADKQLTIKPDCVQTAVIIKGTKQKGIKLITDYYDSIQRLLAEGRYVDKILKQKKHCLSVMCPKCKQVIQFEILHKDILERLHGGLANFIFAEHGEPPHKLEVSIDRFGRVRGAYLTDY